ncbi:MAG: HgcAB-like fusion protein [Acidobacteriota bacterium]
MRLADAPAWLRDTALRFLPHATRPGLRRIGNPDRNSPVLVTGNFALTVRRLRDALHGRDAWLLVANSRGINVWCAASGGHLTDHEVVAAVRASGIGDQVSHRRLVLPQLAATGIERRRITESTGWEAVWGPARLEDLPAYFDRGGSVARRDRWMRFPAWERLEMAAMWTVPMALVAAIALALAAGAATALAGTGALALTVAALFLLLPWLRVTGPLRFPTLAGLAAVQLGIAAGALALAAGPPTIAAWIGLVASAAVSMGLLAVDLAGTTPWYASSVIAHHERPTLELLEDACTGAADCVLVCPRDVLAMQGKRRKVAIARPDDCVRCGACIVQCPSDALRFRLADGRVVEPDIIRSTRLNLLGRRAVEVRRG